MTFQPTEPERWERGGWRLKELRMEAWTEAGDQGKRDRRESSLSAV